MYALQRKKVVKGILCQFSNVQVTVGAHSSVIAQRFSIARGMAVVDQITGYDNGRLSLID
jgi:hypothetical protein